MHISDEALSNLNPNIVKYPCKYLLTGILPLPTGKTYDYQHGKSIVRTKMDLGLSIPRKRARSTPAEFSMTFRMTGEQKEVFESWVENELDGGLEWFYLPFRTGDYDLQTLKCQFTEIPGEDTKFTLQRGTRDFGSVWEMKAKVQAFKPRLERYAARVLSKDSLAGIERASGLMKCSIFGGEDA
ncbi:hypothetical protein [Vibrio cholerae]|uniref:hypothetical protein n=1 Tax=Vibrio cholerae TaxID=666 RepID=UPI0002C17921|nr:hypothetical protein [Vibrio cholerae]EJL6700828.1 hypothetical protein [Vibrio cholerae]EJL9426339.1 hypothetical protein [Vibrio cholerae]EMQ69661.1 hypothetical protein VCNHCC008D_001178 [Vibrio cholerae O1 str. NHCC-008D]